MKNEFLPSSAIWICANERKCEQKRKIIQSNEKLVGIRATKKDEEEQTNKTYTHLH